MSIARFACLLNVAQSYFLRLPDFPYIGGGIANARHFCHLECAARPQ
ncbi:MAG: hypothetical protein WA213_06645 [Terriglobales bacterium]